MHEQSLKLNFKLLIVQLNQQYIVGRMRQLFDLLIVAVDKSVRYELHSTYMWNRLYSVWPTLHVHIHCSLPEARAWGWGYSRFQVTGMIEWGQTSKPKKIPKASNKTQKIPRPKINPQKIPCRISKPSNVMHHILKQLQNKFGCTLFAELRCRDTRTLP